MKARETKQARQSKAEKSEKEKKEKKGRKRREMGARADKKARLRERNATTLAQRSPPSIYHDQA